MKRFGKRVYDGSNDMKREDIGTYICPTCHKSSSLIRQKGYGFQNDFNKPLANTLALAISNIMPAIILSVAYSWHRMNAQLCVNFVTTDSEASGKHGSETI